MRKASIGYYPVNQIKNSLIYFYSRIIAKKVTVLTTESFLFFYVVCKGFEGNFF